MIVIKTKRFWIVQVWLALGLVLFLGLAYSPAAAATVLYTADTSSAVIVQSRRTLRDQDHHSWQVIGFKPIQADGREGGMALRLVGFPGAVEIDHAQPITFTDPKGHTLPVHNISNQIGKDVPLQPHVAQYDLQAVLSELPIDYRLRLEVPTLTPPPVVLQIPPALIQEWQTVVNTHSRDLIDACDKFPAEARQNPAFPAWVGCSSD
nr:MAG: DUF3122 domain-containing protein [Leptolyngbya sp. IPPAS B-1204]